jgi:hypothetical protein
MTSRKLDPCNKCNIQPLVTLQTTAKKYGEYIGKNSYKTIYQGQPSNIIVSHIMSNAAHVRFNKVGTPTYYDLIIESSSQGKQIIRLYTPEHQLINLIPATTYVVNVRAYYTSGDLFQANRTVTFQTDDRWTVSNVQYTTPTNTFAVVSQSFDQNEIVVSFDPAPGSPVQYVLEVDETNYVEYIPTRFLLELKFAIPVKNTSTNTIRVYADYGDVSYSYVENDVSFFEGGTPLRLTAHATALDISYDAAPGDSTTPTYDLSVRDGNLVVFQDTYTTATGILVSSLARNHLYDIELIVSYATTQNQYKSTSSLSTLNESAIQNPSYTADIDSLAFTWNPSPGDVVQYIITLRDIDSNTIIETNTITDANATTITFNNLQMNREYDLSFETQYANNSYVFNKTYQTLHEGVVQDVSAIDITGTSVTLQYQSVGYPDYYIIDYTNTNNAGSTGSVSTYANTKILYNLLAPNTTYSINIRAIYPSSNTYLSTNSISFTTLGQSSVQTIALENVKGDQVQLTWTNYDDITTPNNVFVYVYEAETDLANTIAVNNTITELDVSGLKYNTDYRFSIEYVYENNRYEKSAYQRTANEYQTQISLIVKDETSITFHKSDANNQDKYFLVREATNVEFEWGSYSFGSEGRLSLAPITYYDVTISKDHKRLFFFPDPNTIQVHNVVEEVVSEGIDGSLTKEYFEKAYTVNINGICSIDSNYDGTRIIVGYDTNVFNVYDVSSSEMTLKVDSFALENVRSRHVVISPMGNICAVSDEYAYSDGTANTVFVYDIEIDRPQYITIDGNFTDFYNQRLTKQVMFDNMGTRMAMAIRFYSDKPLMRDSYVRWFETNEADGPFIYDVFAGLNFLSSAKLSVLENHYTGNKFSIDIQDQSYRSGTYSFESLTIGSNQYPTNIANESEDFYMVSVVGATTEVGERWIEITLPYKLKATHSQLHAWKRYIPDQYKIYGYDDNGISYTLLDISNDYFFPGTYDPNDPHYNIDERLENEKTLNNYNKYFRRFRLELIKNNDPFNNGESNNWVHYRLDYWRIGGYVRYYNLVAPSTDLSGNEIALSRDGQHLLVVDDYDVSASLGTLGSTQLYSYNTGTASFEISGNKIWGSAPNLHRKVSLNDDASVIAIGEYNFRENNAYSGQVLVYEANAVGWQQRGQTLQTTDILPESENDEVLRGEWFGFHTSIDGSGTNLMVSTRPKLSKINGRMEGDVFAYTWKKPSSTFEITNWPLTVNNLIPSTTYKFDIVSQYNRDLTYGYTFTTEQTTLQNQKPIPFFTITNGSIKLSWTPVVFGDNIESVQYDLRVYNNNTTIINEIYDYYSDTDVSLSEITLSGLTYNTAYQIKFSSIYTNQIEGQLENVITEYIGFEDTLMTLNEGPVSEFMSLNNDDLVVFQMNAPGLENLATLHVNISGNGVNQSYSLNDSTLIDVSFLEAGASYFVDISNTYLSNYVPPYSSVTYQSDTYTMHDNFTVISQPFPSDYIVNGRFDIKTNNNGNNSYTNYLDNRGRPRGIVAEARGVYLTRPTDIPSWETSQYVFIADNLTKPGPNAAYNTFFKDLAVTDVSYHAMLYRSNENTPGTSNTPAYLQQRFPYVAYPQNYHLTFYVANHDLSNAIYYQQPIQYNTYTVNYKIELYETKPSGTQSLIYETSTLSNVDASWNWVSLKYTLPQSYENVDFRIRRQQNEHNTLYISDLSLVAQTTSFERTPIQTMEFYPDTWTPLSNMAYTWRSDYTTYLSSLLLGNFTVSFWVYTHDKSSSSYSTLVWIGTAEKAKVNVEINNITLRTTTIMEDGSERSETSTSTTLFTAHHFMVTYETTVCTAPNVIRIYKDGQVHHHASFNSLFLEAFPTDNFYLGNPDPQKNQGKVLLRLVRFYDHAMRSDDVHTQYNAELAEGKYNFMGNPALLPERLSFS